jgi:ribosomal protein S18 acetylase RimI-like enzyme
MSDMDLERILELRESVRWSAGPGAFELLRGFRDARWAVAEAPGGSLVGMVGAVPFGEIGVLCHLAVRRSVRGRGLGRRLAEWAVAYLRSQGARTVRLESTPEAESLYRSLGFRDVARRSFYRLRELRGGGGPEGRYRVSPLVIGDLPELYGLDLWSFGADRSNLLQAILRLHPGWGITARDVSGRMVGYLMRTGRRLGPFMAANDGVARTLLACALEARRQGELEVMAPGGGPAGRLLEEFGFAGRPDRLRMELGEKPEPRGLRAYGMTPYLAT